MRHVLLTSAVATALPDAWAPVAACRELFVDGYDASSNRIYDKVNGLTCHQCRQKTLGKRTSCSGCHSLQVGLSCLTGLTLQGQVLSHPRAAPQSGSNCRVAGAPLSNLCAGCAVWRLPLHAVWRECG